MPFDRLRARWRRVPFCNSPGCRETWAEPARLGQRPDNGRAVVVDLATVEPAMSMMAHRADPTGTERTRSRQ